MTRHFLTFTFALFIFILPSTSDAGVVFNFLSNGNAGNTLESSGVFTSNGITVSVSTSTTLGDLTSTFSSNTISAGVNSGGVSDDAPNGIDNGESLTLTFTFDSLASVQVASIDLQGVGTANEGDAAFLSVNSGSNIVLETGSDDFNGNPDVFEPGAFSSAPIFLTSGQSLTITAEETVSLQNITLEPIPNPEPASVLLFGGYLVASLQRRRSRER